MKSKLIIAIFFIFNQIAHSQQTDSIPQKPKIGLVLSGGGAKGLAHIGVLKVIDSLGIKIDYIGGTSMGAVIGGLYAAGYTANQLDSIFSRVDTEALLQDYIPRSSKSFTDKSYNENYAVKLPFDGFKLGLPQGFSKGMYNYNMLSRLMLNVSHITDFHKLPIPFFCVATDIESGKEILLEHGILPQAIVASGAIPSLYNPVEINGQMLMDGGVVNNYPVEQIRKMGADIVIGVDVQDGLKKREELKSANSLLVQITNYSTLEKMDEKRNLTNIYIRPDIKGYSVMSFDKGKELIHKGKTAADSAMFQLSALKAENYNKPKMKPANDSLRFLHIYHSNLNDHTRSYIMGKLRFRENQKISFADFEKGINNLNATQNFKSIWYSFNTVGNSKILSLTLKERERNMFLNAGAHYDNLFKTGILFNLTKKKLLAKNDVFSFDFVLGDNVRYKLNYYIDNGFYWSLGVQSQFQTFSKNTANDFNNNITFNELGINSINISYSDLSNRVSLQTIIAQKFSMGGGTELKHLRISSRNVRNTVPLFENSRFWSVFGFMKFDSYDRNYFPRSGFQFNGETKMFLYSSDYNNNFLEFTYAKADFEYVHTLFNKVTVKFQSEGGFHIGADTPNVFDFFLGGYGFSQVNNLRPFLGYDFLSLSGDSYVKGAVELDYTLYKKHHINFTANYANIGNGLFETLDGWFSIPDYSGYGLGYGYETIIGPAELKASWSPEMRRAFVWFSVGFVF